MIFIAYPASRVAVIVLSGQESSTGTPMLEMTCYRFNLGSELGKARHVSVCPSAEYDIYHDLLSEKVQPCQFSQSSLEPVTCCSRVSMTRHDYADSRTFPIRRRIDKRGSHPDLDVSGPDTPPLSCYSFEFGTPRNSGSSRVPKWSARRSLRRPRTYPGFVPSVASFPSFGDEQEWHAPILFPSGREIHVSSADACFVVGTSVFPFDLTPEPVQ